MTKYENRVGREGPLCDDRDTVRRILLGRWLARVTVELTADCSTGAFFRREQAMRLTVAHNRTKREVIQSVERSFDDLIQTAELHGVKLKDVGKTWQGSTITLGLRAKLGLFSTPIKGTIEVTDTDITIDADLGRLERLISASTTREILSARVRGWLNECGSWGKRLPRNFRGSPFPACGLHRTV
jgi:hypothetical protein